MALDCSCLICFHYNQLVAPCFAELPKPAWSDWKAPGSTGCPEGIPWEGHAALRDFVAKIVFQFCELSGFFPCHGRGKWWLGLVVVIQMPAWLCKPLDRSLKMRRSSVMWLFKWDKLHFCMGRLERQCGKSLQKSLYRHLTKPQLCGVHGTCSFTVGKPSVGHVPSTAVSPQEAAWSGFG